MFFAIMHLDKPDSAALRQATRPAHIDYLRAHVARIIEGGPMLDAQGRPCGSLIIVDAADQAEAEALVAADPYVAAGLFASSVIRPYRRVFTNGAYVE